MHIRLYGVLPYSKMSFIDEKWSEDEKKQKKWYGFFCFWVWMYEIGYFLQMDV